MKIDINCDLGEGIGNDETIMPFISSANIACGYHAGDDTSMDQTIQLAKKYHVAIGAHPGYEDKENFGRTNLSLTYSEIVKLVADQINIINQRAIKANTRLFHVKAHGALYNQASKDINIAKAIAEGISYINKNLIYVGLANSVMQEAAESFKLKFRAEAFADRSYDINGLLIPRKEPGAVIQDSNICKKRALHIAQHKAIKTIEQQMITINAQTICIHGDNPHAIENSKMIYDYLTENNIKITADV